jgi:4-diphosphocytidyl-2-C-methyl-D-erythritol kinase
VKTIAAPGKINLALVVGPQRSDGKHEVATVMQRVDLSDQIALAPARGLEVMGFSEDTLVRRALHLLAEAANAEPGWAVRIDKRIPVAAGLGGGSSDAASALRLANETLAQPLSDEALHALAASLGADVPFFLSPGPQLGQGDGTDLSSLELPQDFWVVLCLPANAHKVSTRAVYEEFDARDGARGFSERRGVLLSRLAAVRKPMDLALLPANDLASSPLARELQELGAFRADVSGAGPTVFGLFADEPTARAAERYVRDDGESWVCTPAWYG